MGGNLYVLLRDPSEERFAAVQERCVRDPLETPSIMREAGFRQVMTYDCERELDFHRVVLMQKNEKRFIVAPAVFERKLVPRLRTVYTLA
jgi:hypothetical protein